MPDAKGSNLGKSSTSAPHRILLLVTQADWGGVQSFLIRFAMQLKENGCEVLLAGGGTGELWRRATENHIPTHRLTQVVREISPIKDVCAIRELIKLIDEYQPEAVHLNSSKMGVVGSLAAAFSKTKPRVVYRIGGWVFLEPLPGWKKWLYRTLEKSTARFKDTIITVHPGDQVAAERLGFKPRVQFMTVPNGLDVANFTEHSLDRTQARETLELSSDAFVYGTVANAYATKGLLPYLDVLRKILDADPGAYAVILGDGPEFEKLKNKCDTLGLKRLILTGQRPDASRLYRAFDVFVLPSLKEGMPWTVLEAMAAATPVVASDVGACHWMLEADADRPAGLVVPPGDAEKLELALRKIRHDADLRQRLGQAGHDIVKRRFAWTTTFRGNADALFGR